MSLKLVFYFFPLGYIYHFMFGELHVFRVELLSYCVCLFCDMASNRGYQLSFIHLSISS